MDIVELRELCLSFPHTTEEFPFDETTLVFKVFNKMFCCTDIMPFEWIAVKCDPNWAIELPGLPFQQKILERDKYARLPAR